MARTRTLSASYSKCTVEEELQFNQGVRSKVDTEQLDNEQEATHVVTRVRWGGNCNVHCVDKKTKVPNRVHAR